MMSTEQLEALRAKLATASEPDTVAALLAEIALQLAGVRDALALLAP